MAPHDSLTIIEDEVIQSPISQSKIDSLSSHILNNLTNEEKEQAARASSYKYLVLATDPSQNPSSDLRDEHAKVTIEKYLTVEQKLHKSHPHEQWAINAQTKFKKTLEFRNEYNVDDIRLCFKGESDSELHAHLRDGLLKRYCNGASVVRGYSKEGHALLQNFPRTETAWDEEFFIKGNIFMLEKALACTERRTDGSQNKVIVMYDYSGYGLANAPPTKLVGKLLMCLRDHFPEKLQNVFVVDAPFVFRAFWAIIKHFIDPITKELVCFISGEEAKKQVLGSIIEENEASTWMFDGAKVDCEVDVKTFFKDTPFEYTYGEN
ncbi:hypothetical protein ACHAWO_003985 [Cyclotella atomus]|jgi:hypothetical protein|uniref:CRAL-TRIO domain-containing protein n=1 Tax=Cyclotella atomus TaxID=382360 RepID=A0ABD3P3C3_9STRA